MVPKASVSVNVQDEALLRCEIRVVCQCACGMPAHVALVYLNYLVSAETLYSNSISNNMTIVHVIAQARPTML